MLKTGGPSRASAENQADDDERARRPHIRVNLSDAGSHRQPTRENTRPTDTPSTGSGDQGWFTRAQILEYQQAADNEVLSKLVGGTHPGASREETLFRYHVSKSVYLGHYELPPLPTTTAQILRLGQRVDATTGDYVKALQSDASMVSGIIQVSNSALFSGNQEYRTLEQAITRIGLAEVEKTALLHTFNSKVFRVPGHGRTVARLVEHGMVSSLAAQAFGRLFELPGSTAFVTGLFHDVGKFITLQMLAQVQRQRRWIAPKAVVESAFEAFHVQLGTELCRSWDSPEHVLEAVASHHDPERASLHGLSRATYLGNRLAHAIEQGATPETTQDSAFTDVLDSWFSNDPVANQVQLTPDRVHAILEQTHAELAAFRGR